MAREPLPQQVAEALAKIPHATDCTALRDFPDSDDDDFVLGLAGRGPCDCDREVRIAAAVARAIEASYRAWRSQVPGDREQTAINAALQALGEAPRP